VTEPAGVSGLIREAPERDALLGGRRILVADDEEIIRETIADVLSKAGALTVMASDGKEATAMIRAQHFDLVLSDIKMPHRNGYEVFAAAREVNEHCPVILITGFGYDPNHAIVRASKEGLAGVLFKPFKVEQLLDEVRHALTEVQG
jgi:DNA-binding NtrC family response regulator